MGAYLPFAITKTTATDKRLSLAERYKEQDDYMNRIRIAARKAEAAGFLLPEDAAIIVNAATASPIFDPVASSDPPR